MKNNLSSIFPAALAAFVLTLTLSASATDTQTVLYNFQGIHTKKADGANPEGGVIADSAGNLYGTTNVGGACSFDTRQGCGIVYELSNSGGTWSETILYTFTGGADGAFPTGNLVFDASGNLYGEAAAAGASTACSDGCGTIFELSPSSSGTWTFSVIYNFTGISSGDGSAPTGGLIFDASGNLYGTATDGGTGTSNCGIGCGEVFELSPSSGGWTKTTIYNFPGGSTGEFPIGGVIFDPAGNLYGTLAQGGSFNVNGGCSGVGCGTVFRLMKVSGGWRFGLLYTFQGPRGLLPQNGVVMDAAGNLYGTTVGGGSAKNGEVFELSPTAVGQWKQTLLHSFSGNTSTDGFNPQALSIDASGNIYGMSNTVAFKLSPGSTGGWIFQILSTLAEGNAPHAPLLRDTAGNFYGVSYTSGSQSVGTVYELTPNTADAK
jgi:uncharacterized repeat protein (TIGR03803 family)